MALENTRNEMSAFDIKCEPFDSGNITLNLIKDGYIDECYYNVKVEKQSVLLTMWTFLLKV